VPGQLLEVVLRAHQVRPGEQVDGTTQRRHVIADVIVGDHDALVDALAQPGDDAVHLAHAEAQVGMRSEVSSDTGQRRRVPGEQRRRRAVDNEDLVDRTAEPTQVGA
jgi:hypothetical protein